MAGKTMVRTSEKVPTRNIPAAVLTVDDLFDTAELPVSVYLIGKGQENSNLNNLISQVYAYYQVRTAYEKRRLAYFEAQTELAETMAEYNRALETGKEAEAKELRIMVLGLSSVSEPDDTAWKAMQVELISQLVRHMASHSAAKMETPFWKPGENPWEESVDEAIRSHNYDTLADLADAEIDASTIDEEGVEELMETFDKEVVLLQNIQTSMYAFCGHMLNLITSGDKNDLAELFDFIYEINPRLIRTHEITTQALLNEDEE